MITAPAGATPRAGGRLAVIDGLRLIAALAVAAYHYTGFAPGVRLSWGVAPETAFPTFRHFSQYGFLGVELFFMISGFVICMSTWGRTPGEFFRSRVIRLFPAYWAAILITTAVVVLWPTVREPQHWSVVLANLSMLQAGLGVSHVDGVYWTLWSEGLFYLLFLIVVWRGLTMRRAIIFGYAWLIGAVLAVRSEFPVFKTLMQSGYAAFFVAGIALYLIYRFGPNLVLWGLLGASYVLAQYFTVVKLRHVGKDFLGLDLSLLTGAGVVTLFFAVLLVVALGWTSGVQWRWLTTAGLLTYPFYLLHEYIGWTLIHALRDLAPRAVIVGLVVSIMLVAAYLLHRLIEKPLARLMKVKLAEASDAIRAADRPAGTDQPAATNQPAATDRPAVPAQRSPLETETLSLPVLKS